MLDLDTGPFQIYLNNDDANGIVRCNGAYSDYMRAKEDAKATHIKLHEQQEAQRSKLTAHRRASEQVTNKNYNSKSEQGISTKFLRTALKLFQPDAKVMMIVVSKHLLHQKSVNPVMKAYLLFCLAQLSV